MSQQESELLRIEGLKTHFFTDDGIVRAVDGVSLHIAAGETLGVVGESGCGKSVTAFSVLRLMPSRRARIVEGAIWFTRRDGTRIDLTELDPYGDEIRSIRGNEIAMIFQEPMTSLSPMHTIGDQIMESIILHQNVDKREAEERAIAMLEAVSIGNAREFIRSYPHQYSGGMRQRAMIAMALSCNPSVLIADEPTTALDVTIQAQILDLMRHLQQEFESAIIMITHNLGVINETADRIAVMYLGKIVEIAESEELYTNPLHPYTQALLSAVPVPDPVVEETRQRIILKGDVPSPINPPKGCNFNTRCPVSVDVCFDQDPEFV